MKTRKVQGKVVYLSEECGFGYENEETADGCERWCSSHKSCNLEITKIAIYTT